jgi:hypothetical protein
VVSTGSIGGRDEYFDDRFCLVSEDNPSSVAAAVSEVISRNLEPNMIRNTFLAKVMKRRAGLLRFIIDRTAGWKGELERFIRDWMNIGTPFFDDRDRWFTASQLLEEIDSMQRSDSSPAATPNHGCIFIKADAGCDRVLFVPVVRVVRRAPLFLTICVRGARVFSDLAVCQASSNTRRYSSFGTVMKTSINHLATYARGCAALRDTGAKQFLTT